MKTNTNSKSLKVTTAIRAGGLGCPNHSRKSLAVKAGIKAGAGMVYANNHSRRLAK